MLSSRGRRYDPTHLEAREPLAGIHLLARRSRRIDLKVLQRPSAWIDREVKPALMLADKRRAFAGPYGARKAALDALFGVLDHRHALAQSSVNWINFSEPQLTTGLAHFLGRDKDRLCRAFLFAIDPSSEVSADAVWDAPCAEKKIEEVNKTSPRIDLLVVCRENGSKHSCVVEAKFRAPLTNPLGLYRDFAESEFGSLSTLAIIAPGMTKEIFAAINRSDIGHWRLLSWFVFLVRLEKAMRNIGDDADFALHRSLIWEKL